MCKFGTYTPIDMIKTSNSNILDIHTSKKMRISYANKNIPKDYMIHEEQKENMNKNISHETFYIIKRFQESFCISKSTNKPVFGGPNSAFDWVRKK